MSPLGSSAATPEPALERALPKQVELSPGNPAGKRWAVLLVVAAVAAAGWFLRPRPNRDAAETVRTVRTQRGPLRASLRLSGTVAARNFASIAAPRLQGPDTGRGLVLVYLVGHGSQVSAGDVLARIDGQSIRDHLVDVEAQLAQARLDVAGGKARLAAEFESLRQSARSAKASYERWVQDMLALSVHPAVDQELMKLNAEEAEAVYYTLQEELDTLWERQATQLRVADLDFERQFRHRNRHLADIERMEIRAPISGQAILRTTYRNGQERQVKLGDELHSGQPFLRIVDLSVMQVEATMNQAEVNLVRLGQPAVVRFDAYPDLVLNGRVDSVGIMALGGRQTEFYIRRVPVRIAIEGSDPRVMSDISASADVLVADEPDAILAPREAIQENGGRQVVYLKQGDGFVEREVEIGATNATQAAVKSGLEEGDEIALHVPSSM